MIPVVMPVYARADVVFERGEGPYLFDTEGRRYLDFTSGIAVNAFGHAHPYLVAALEAQARKLWHVSNLFRVAGQESLALRLVTHTFADTVFFANSGVEAWECGTKLVRKYQYESGHPERYRIITFEGSFHGRTMTAIAAAKQEKMVKGFGPLIDAFDQVPFGDLDAVRAAIGPHTAGICIEPVQGEGGVRPASVEFMRGLRQLCDENGILLYLDEIQCGMGRTGKLFAHEWAGITPDVMCIAKAIGGGFPIGACLATEKAAAGMTVGSHGTTFGGNPLATAVGNAVMDLMLAPGFLDGVQVVAAQLRAALNDVAARHPGVLGDVRGSGLLLGVKAVPANGILIQALRGNGLLTVAAGDNVVRLLPPLIITRDQIDEAVAIIDRTCRELVP